MYKAGELPEKIDALVEAIDTLVSTASAVRDHIVSPNASVSASDVSVLNDDLTTTLGLAVSIESEMSAPHIDRPGL